MTTFMKKLWRDKRGNALIIAGGALPLLVGSVGLATDTVQWVTWKRQLQRAADSAALAGVYARFQGQGAEAAVNKDLTTNNHLWVPLATGYPQVTQPADTTDYTMQVEVGLAVQRSLTFSSMFMSSAPVIQVSARAAAVDSGTFCVIAKENTAVPGIIIQGSASVNMGCGMISNSPSASVSVDVIGGGHNVTAEPVAGVGGVENINGVTNEQSYHVSQPDPYQNQHSTDIPSSETCTSFNHASKTNSDGSKKPGCYNNFTPGNNTQLAPGVYYLNNASISMTGNDKISGTGVTLIFTGTDPGIIDIRGNSDIDLTAPTATTCGTFNVNTCDYTNMLMIQSATADIRNENEISGSNETSLDGVIYFPNGLLKFTGSSSAATKCAMIVGRVVHFSGSTDIQNNTTGCVANEQASGKAIRLIA